MNRFLLICMFVLPLAGPAATQAGAQDDLMSMYKGYEADTLNNLNEPHRGADELGSWVSDAVARALTFTPGDIARKLGEVRPLFTENGYKAYLAFLGEHGYAQGLRDQTLALSAIVNNAPLVIGQGASGGRYAWAFELPVVLSTPRTASGAPKSQNATLRIQLGRTQNAGNGAGVLIENWQEFKEAPAQ